MKDLSSTRKTPDCGGHRAGSPAAVCVARRRTQAGRCGFAHPPAGDRRRHAAVKHADVPIYLSGLGTVQAFYTVTVTRAGRRRIAADCIHRGSGRQEGRPARTNRSAPEPGGLRTGGGHQGQGRGAARERQARSGPLRGSAAPGSGEQTDRRHGARRGRPTQRPAAGRPSRHRQCPHPARLHPHHLADRRPHRHTPGGSRQHRARRGGHRHRGRDAGCSPSR